MASKKPSMIDALRAKHDPHYQLAGKVESLQKDIPIQLAQLHKTLSKSFAMQRKTLTRVLGLEERVTQLEAQKEAIQDVVEDIEDVIEDEPEEEIPEGLDDALDDIRGEQEIGGDEPTGAPEVATKPKKKKPRIRIKKKRISADDLKKGTPFDEGFKSRVMGLDEKGEYLSPEERKFRFKKGNDGATVDPSKLLPCLLYTSPSPRDRTRSRMPSSA